MSDKQKNKRIPKLRFPEFKDSGEWVENNISQLGETINGLSGKKGDDFGSGSPYVQYKQVFDKNYIDFSHCGKVIIGKNEKQNKLQKGDILFTTSSETPNEVGFASVIISQPNEPTYLNSFCFILRPNSLDNLEPNFSRYLFHSKIYRKKVNAIAQGAIRYNLSKKAFLQITLPIPNPKEQQKIASFLSNLDELIEAHKQKLELLKRHKKGLMQNLFPQEGEKVPKLRFPEFKDSGEWVEKKLGELLKSFKLGGNYSNSEKRTSKPLMKMGNIGRGNFILNKILYIEETEIADEGDIMKAGDLFLNTRNTLDLVGKVAIWREELPLAYYNSNLMRLNFDNNYFMNYWFNFDKGIKELKKYATGTTSVAAIYTKDLLKLKLFVPNEQEQQKIASCLSSISEIITAEAEMIEQLERHKKGLMQGLFPQLSAL